MTAAEKEYGLALYELAVEENCQQEVLQSLAVICDLLKQFPEYCSLLQNPAIPKQERLALLDKAFAEQVHGYTLNFIKILCERMALTHLFECKKAYEEKMYEAQGILPAVVQSAVALTQEQMQALCSKIEHATGKKVQLTNEVDSTLIGGVKLSYQGKEFDSTVLGRMQSMRRALMQA